MALSMDEQRILAEIERRLAAEDPGLASRLSSFRRSGPTIKLRTTKGMMIGALLGVALIGAISILVFTMMPFRAHPIRTNTPVASTHPVTSAQMRNIPGANTVAKPPTTAKSSAANSPTPNTATHP
jgi:hypothetical protein